ncbi:hypothetical protein PCANC_25677 [Puccinia coronata f. sp. avenae]|uniref:Uncharacterized protein n=1 Tax=Puccinia coronata f. sp. avenae TaxID=200324 RepID=A0A2N5S543_9BASI|nr:hypothetical protein PCANC_25677 [Puccinia coronata f. sp. avenae]
MPKEPTSPNNAQSSRSASPSIMHQTGLSTEELLYQQALLDSRNIPSLSTNSPTPTQSNQKDKHPADIADKSFHHSIPPNNRTTPPKSVHFTSPHSSSVPPFHHSDQFHDSKSHPFTHHIPPHLRQEYNNTPTPNIHTPYFPTHSAQTRQDQLSRALEESKLRRIADEDRRHTASIIASAVKLIRPRDILLADSSNYHELANFNTIFEAVTNLKNRFCSVCRAAQIATFLKLLRVEPDSFESTSAYAVEMRDILSDLKALDIQITEDRS